MRDTMSIEIQTGIDMPKAARGPKKSPIRAALESMAPGQSFLVGTLLESAIRNAAVAAKAKVRIAEDHEGNRRCWRVA